MYVICVFLWLLTATGNEHIIVAVMHGNRPPLGDITGPPDLVLFATKWIPLCWHQSPDERPSFDGKHCCSDTCDCHCVS